MTQGRSAKRARRSVSSSFIQVEACSAGILSDRATFLPRDERLCGLSGLQEPVQASAAYLWRLAGWASAHLQKLDEAAPTARWTVPTLGLCSTVYRARRSRSQQFEAAVTPTTVRFWSHDRATRPAMPGRMPSRFRDRIREESVARRRGELEWRLSSYESRLSGDTPGQIGLETR